MTKILIAGDWHGNTSWMTSVLFEASRDGYDTIIHVGDLMVLWPGDRWPHEPTFTGALVDLLERLNIRLIFVDGNHEAHPALRSLPLTEEGFGRISDHLLYAPRGHR
ncbi:metallophosphoesterase [Arthrobacter sp. CAN_C5]|uniref:metallophosphoesterase n=1 Tax=Arthrobacter sp. CAN_C5 TaxID=2760706 RepID=UPI001AEADA91|nr:metallophosphoesterase [Arthrobacter sp. CAN_C5]MBP2216001.1 putative phosphodiesterase [Arthrobacter sp. CAN_C5]